MGRDLLLEHDSVKKLVFIKKLCYNDEKMTGCFLMKQGFIDLHLHLDGSISVKSARELAKIENITLPQSDAALKAALMVSEDCKDLNEYLTKFDLPCTLLQSEESIALATCNLCSELKEMGYIYAEIRFAPQKHMEKGLTQEAAVEAAIQGLKRADFNAQLILCCMRDGKDNAAENLETVRLTKKYLGQGVCACDLAGAEALYKNEKYAYIFEAAKKENIPFTIHSGEALGAESVSLALDYGAKRIGHGIRAIEDMHVVKRLAEEGVPLEICPTSNINTAVFEKIEDMPIAALMEKGVVVTINADNMSVSGTNVIRELERVKEAFGFRNKDIKGLLVNAVNAAFLPAAEKERLMKKVEACHHAYIIHMPFKK